MTKTLKASVAIILAIIMACGSLTAFAQAPADIEWYFGGDEPWIYSYAGSVSLGETICVEPTADSRNVYLTIDVEESGCYKVTADVNGWYGIPEEKIDGAYHSTLSAFSQLEFDAPEYYYFEKGQQIIGFDFDTDGTATVKIEYAGDIKKIEYGENAFNGCIENYDFYCEEEGVYFSYVENLAVEFTLGEKVVSDFGCVYIYTDKDLVRGEYDVEIGLYDMPYRESAKINVICVDDIIEKLEITNLDKLRQVTFFYDGYFQTGDAVGETLTVTYTDGTVEKVEDFNGYCELERNGYPVSMYYSEDENGEWTLRISVANNDVLCESCTVLQADLVGDIKEYFRANNEAVSETVAWIGYYFAEISYADSFAEKLEMLGAAFSFAAKRLFYLARLILINTTSLISFYS